MKNLNNPKPVRFGHQGDICVGRPLPLGSVKLGEEIPRTANGALVLAEGESTGHAHEVFGAGARLFASDQPGLCYLRVEGAEPWTQGAEIGPTHITLLHEEHGPGVFVQDRIYPIIRQCQWTSDRRARFVVD